MDEPYVKEVVTVDPFLIDYEVLKKYDGLTSSIKKRLTRAVKAGDGEGAQSKALLPDQSLTTAYGLLDVIIPPYNLDELAGFYDSSYANRAAINAKVTNSVSLGYGFEITQAVLEQLDRASSESAKKKIHAAVEKDKFIIEEWLEARNDMDTVTHILEKVITDYEAVGNGYLEIGRTVTGEIGYIGHIPATTIRVRRKRDGYVQIVNQNVVFFSNFQSQPGYNPITADPRPNEIIHIAKYTPRNGYYGVPDMVSAAAAIVGDQLAAKYNLDYFENKAVPRYIVTLKGGTMSRQAERDLFKFLQSGIRGQNHRTLFIPLPPDKADSKVEFKMQAVETGIQDGSFEKYRTSNRNDVLMAHGVPASKLGGSLSTSIAAALSADRTFKESNSRPLQRTVEKIMTRIIKEKTDMFKFKLNELSLTDENTQSQIDERYLRMQVVVPNEIRDRMRLPMREGGDKVVDLKAQTGAEQTAQATGNRQRDQQRTNNATDSTSTNTGRNPKGEGRTQA